MTDEHAKISIEFSVLILSVVNENFGRTDNTCQNLIINERII